MRHLLRPHTNTARLSLIAAFCVSLLMAFDDYANILITVRKKQPISVVTGMPFLDVVHALFHTRRLPSIHVDPAT